jgi:hypothetical protein
MQSFNKCVRDTYVPGTLLDNKDTRQIQQSCLQQTHPPPRRGERSRQLCTFRKDTGSHSITNSHDWPGYSIAQERQTWPLWSKVPKPAGWEPTLYNVDFETWQIVAWILDLSFTCSDILGKSGISRSIGTESHNTRDNFGQHTIQAINHLMKKLLSCHFL